MGTFKELKAYTKAFRLALDIHRSSQKFPKEEQYALTGQIRRSSRSVCVNMGEGFRKLRYPAHFIAKITDADMENSETQVWLDFALEFTYLNKVEHDEFYQRSSEVGCLLNHTIENPGSYGTSSK